MPFRSPIRVAAIMTVVHVSMVVTAVGRGGDVTMAPARAQSTSFPPMTTAFTTVPPTTTPSTTVPATTNTTSHPCGIDLEHDEPVVGVATATGSA